MASGYLRQGNPAATAEAIRAAGQGLVSLLITHTRYVWSDITAVKAAHVNLILHGLLTERGELALARDAASGQNA
ncbi:MAG: hypothetical protein Dbin4_01389 [Alphaproteobacteria bacterium]|nr:hypothetical protein [Alphaproteobacteria bacterium]